MPQSRVVSPTTDMADKQADETQQTFETAMKRLEQIVAAMDDHRMPLDDLIVNYEEGTKLVKVCEARLAEAEKKVEIILRRAGGVPELAEFSPDAPTNSPAAKPTPRGDVSLF